MLSEEEVTSPLTEMRVLVVDAQATGATPALGSLLEIGWSIATAGAGVPETEARWLKLPEGTRISRVVREITGYRDEFAREAIEPAEAWRALLASADRARDAAGTIPTVIHFAQFEARFLRDWHARFAPDAPYPFDVCCLHAVARRIYPNLPRSGLRALAGFLGHSTALERRSAGHVEASAHVWRTLVGELGNRGVRTWSDLLTFASAPLTEKRKRVFPMPVEVKRGLPNEPGVYRFLRSNGDVLYVGKAASIKKRVASHFTGAPRNGERAMEMLTQAQRVDVTVTPTILESALLECDEIKRLDPPYNVHLRERSAWFSDRAMTEVREAPDHDHPLGPFPSRYSVLGYGAVRSVARGEEATPLVRARAMGVPIAFAPDEATFREGWDAFRAKHLGLRSRSEDGKLARAALRLRELLQEGLLEEGEEDAPPGWDVPRVVRHLERSVLSGSVLLRRARWLVLLADAVVRYEERGREREIEIARGELVELRDPGSEATVRPPAEEPPRTRRERQAAFDGAKYDRLRVLTTELRRVITEGGSAVAFVGKHARLETEALRRLLRYG